MAISAYIYSKVFHWHLAPLFQRIDICETFETGSGQSLLLSLNLCGCARSMGILRGLSDVFNAWDKLQLDYHISPCSHQDDHCIKVATKKISWNQRFISMREKTYIKYIYIIIIKHNKTINQSSIKTIQPIRTQNLLIPLHLPGRPNSFSTPSHSGGFSLERRSLLSSTSAKTTESAISMLILKYYKTQ